MQIILKEDVANLGHKNDIVEVKPGYGRNYLIPKSLGILATPSARKVHAENIRQRSHKEVKVLKDAQEIAQKLDGLKITIGAKTSSTGKIFGSVNNIQIAEALAKAGFNIERKHIAIKEEHIKEIGTYSAIIKLHKDIKATIEFEVFSE
jgi:large subunit ribosomal protein L9